MLLVKGEIQGSDEKQEAKRRGGDENNKKNTTNKGECSLQIKRAADNSPTVIRVFQLFYTIDQLSDSLRSP